VKKYLTTLALVILAGCNSATGLLSRDLDSLSVDLYPERPALVRGSLRDGIDPASFVQAASLSGVSELTLGQTGADPDEITELAPIPVAFSSSLGRRRVEGIQKGLYWHPAYEFVIHAESLAVTASVEIVNLTGQEWIAPVSICDRDGERLGGADTPLVLAPGSRNLFWWSAATLETRAVLSFGWPVPGRWSALLAIPAPDGGPVFDGGSELWMESSEDTLWCTGDMLLDVTQEMTPRGRGYSGDITVRNVAAWPVTVAARAGAGLSSGAVVTLAGMPDSLVLEPGESRQLQYSLAYPD
jgi:hypothetical protein